MPTKSKKTVPSNPLSPIGDWLTSAPIKPSQQGRFTGTVAITVDAGAWGDLIVASLGKKMPIEAVISELVETYANESANEVES